jgi:rhodanese-related sulfurtransferase
LSEELLTVSTISPRELSSRQGNSQAVDLIDVRTPIEFRELHAALARNIPLDELDPAAFMASRMAPADQPVYIFCRSGGRSRQACAKFLTAGHPNVVNVEGGTLAWAESGLPVVRGKKVVSLDRQVRIAAGSLVHLGALLGWLVDPAFVGLSAFVGAGLVFAGVTDTFRMELLLARMP